MFTDLHPPVDAQAAQVCSHNPLLGGADVTDKRCDATQGTAAAGEDGDHDQREDEEEEEQQHEQQQVLLSGSRATRANNAKEGGRWS